jgi:DNA-binding SARP family transcriptional activator
VVRHAAVIEFRILGPLEVMADGSAPASLPAKPRALLAILLLNANQVVTADRLVAGLWGEEPPPSAAKLLQGYVSKLRSVLPEPLLETRPGGYLLTVDAGALDLARFEDLLADGRAALAAGELDVAVDRLRTALGLWRGAPLADLADAPFAGAAVPHLEELRLAALEACVDADLRLGRHAQVVGELRDLAAAHPYRERLRWLLMLALYRCGRQAEALAVYRDTRRLLADELGLEPDEPLRRLEGQILAHAPELDLEPEPGAAPATPVPRSAEPAEPAGGRRLVSVVSARLADAAALAERLDPEALHALHDACWERCAGVFEHHGGAVERFAGDAIVGVFGLRGAHDDDALRALRAAAELRGGDDADLRVGVDTGQVFVGASARAGTFATGEPVSHAGQLGAAAAAGEVLFSERTRRLAGDTVLAEPAGAAFRLLAFADAPPPPASPFVGRARELAELGERFAAADGCRMVTVVGPPGIGKSRLVRELLDGLDATVLVGRCLAYGEGITYRPLAEIVRALGTPGPAELLDEQAARAVLGAVGAVDVPGRPEETAWAFRRLFETLAAERPLVVAIEDVHWAEPTLLDLLDYVAAFSTGFPILLLCLARPELLEARPGWAAPQPGRSVLTLEPLSDAESGELAARLDAGPAAAGIVARAEGNPLFLEQLIAVSGQADEALPTSIDAVLAARIDRLAPDERAVLAHAAVEGRSFHAGALREPLAGVDVATQLVALVRKQLIRSEPPELAGEDGFRFAHTLIREAAYEGLSKQRRAELHAHVGGWLALRPDALDELVGHHLERSCRYVAELGRAPDPALAGAAAERLAVAARAALTRGDMPAGASLLERAVALLEDATALLPALGAALFEAGRLADAERVLGEAIAAAGAREDAVAVARARVEQQFVRLHEGGGLAAARTVADAALPVLERAGDELGQCRAWGLRAWIAWTESQAARAADAWRRAAGHAQRAGEQREHFEILCWRASAAAFGPLPVPDAIALCTEIRAQVGAGRVADAVVLHPLGLLHALSGDFDTARRLIGEGNRILDELGRLHSAVSHHEAMVDMLAGQPEAAERRLRQGYERLAGMGERALLATTEALLAQALIEQGRGEEAEALCAAAAEHADAGDVITHAIWRAVRARALARRDRLDEAETLARAAVALARGTDAPVEHGDALLALAEVLDRRGVADAARATVHAALDLYERKGATVLADRARSQLVPTTTTRR